jgi:hypothetical protein
MHKLTLGIALPLLFAGLPACQGGGQGYTRAFGQEKPSLARLDALLERVERFYVETELAQERVHSMLEAVAAATAPGAPDPHAAHARCVEATDAASAQATAFRAAVPFFERWELDLDGFASAELRERSRARMEETRALYEEIRVAAAPARSGYESFQRRVHDLTVFLGNDFNPSALSALEADLRAMTDQAARVAAQLEACLRAADAYATHAAPPRAPAASTGPASTQASD